MPNNQQTDFKTNLNTQETDYMADNEIKNELTEAVDYKTLEKEIATEIGNYEYFKAKGLNVNLFKHSESGKDSTMIKVMKGTKVLYVRTFEGYSDEIRYMCYFYLYRDIFNQGLMMMDKLSIEQEKLDKEKNIIETVNSKDTLFGSGLLDKNGKKL